MRIFVSAMIWLSFVLCFVIGFFCLGGHDFADKILNSILFVSIDIFFIYLACVTFVFITGDL